MNKPRIFIGSSSEGLNIAYAIQQNLEDFAEITTWKQGVFKLSTPIMTNLLNSLNNFEFAIFVFSPDDITNLRGVEYSTARDNVIFETGLFTGKLGIEHIFFVKPKGQYDLHLPTDLLGIISGEYDSKRRDDNLIAGTLSFCNQVKQDIESILKRKTNTSDENIEGYWFDTSTNPAHITLVQIKLTKDGYLVEGKSFDKITKEFFVNWNSVFGILKEKTLYTNYVLTSSSDLGNMHESGLLNLKFSGVPSNEYIGHHSDYSGKNIHKVKGEKISNEDLIRFNHFKEINDKKKFLSMKLGLE